jgi:hypothetical protein
MIAAALLLAAAQPAGPAWELVFESPGGRLFLDPASLRRDGGAVEFSFRAVRNSPDSDGHQTALVASRVDCAARTMTVLSERFLDATGNVVRTNEFGAQGRETQPIRRASPANAAFYRRLCGADLDGNPG